MAFLPFEFVFYLTFQVPERSVFSTMVDRDKINQQSSIEKKRSRRRNVQSLYNSSLQSGSSSREKQLELKRRRVEWSKLSEKQPSEFRSPKQLLSQVQTEPVMPKQRRPSLLRYFTTPKEATKSPENGEIKVRVFLILLLLCIGINSTPIYYYYYPITAKKSRPETIAQR